MHVLFRIPCPKDLPSTVLVLTSTSKPPARALKNNLVHLCLFPPCITSATRVSCTCRERGTRRWSDSVSGSEWRPCRGFEFGIGIQASRSSRRRVLIDSQRYKWRGQDTAQANPSDLTQCFIASTPTLLTLPQSSTLNTTLLPAIDRDAEKQNSQCSYSTRTPPESKQHTDHLPHRACTITTPVR
jgi:hypothetical protein